MASNIKQSLYLLGRYHFNNEVGMYVNSVSADNGRWAVVFD